MRFAGVPVEAALSAWAEFKTKPYLSGTSDVT
jgi:hypothetical protein